MGMLAGAGAEEGKKKEIITHIRNFIVCSIGRQEGTGEDIFSRLCCQRQIEREKRKKKGKKEK